MSEQKPYALIAEFDSVATIMRAAEKVRDADYMIWDVHSPMPIHGINKSMGLPPTILPWITLVHGLAGAVFGLLMCWWMNATTVPGLSPSVQGYEFMISGKPTFSLPANIPIIFETTVLFAAIGTVLGMLGLNKLPMLYNPLSKSRRFLRATSDRFFIVIEAEDKHFELEKTKAFLESLGPTAIEVVIED
ncbi:hypothetical protein Q31b_09930 [Novipirellula aureliae]|uniref:DUF3341 domain-containing protein n=1 Tax=Novipirellula aureliae TaxID=2527966 RepID=A0A5C6ECX6_9BACT|nr:DUF3341 domain-containing protein [Novipirellula aureliae]TWU45817.1 hypothetical protein Q31b_09930 [Novipirellula aureliae]